jgi:hypothetical protein
VLGRNSDRQSQSRRTITFRSQLGRRVEPALRMDLVVSVEVSMSSPRADKRIFGVPVLRVEPAGIKMQECRGRREASELQRRRVLRID